ncbi:pseudouridine synthase [Endozoicomonas sp. OPT23]|uniref:pseudouridine synthase n=1 Tax=Endozoicomonas sp. OPT23 TaxID=2072845 RepID=UPI00129AD635|nr:pseudouridine synthase [Endozoicomonas sp. OPT23]MRI34443.1 pseudouridine synthase [Endozoicomonas sp. OPT23]
MAIADKPSVVTMPPEITHLNTVLDFLCWKFSAISRADWQNRIAKNNVHWQDGVPITATDAYAGHKRVFYYREVEQEPVIPFTETIVYQDEHIIVACKPHFLPVTPGGRFVQECLLNRLRLSTGIYDLTPAHRIDRDTAGLVLFSVNPETRSDYHELFPKQQIHKRYHAVVHTTQAVTAGQEWQVKKRMVVAEPRFRMKISEGIENSYSRMVCLSESGNKALFQLEPVTGKRHQLRLHMSELGMALVNDRYYPELQPETADDYQKPLQLLAKTLEFKDPVAGVVRRFESDRVLSEAGQLALL